MSENLENHTDTLSHEQAEKETDTSLRPKNTTRSIIHIALATAFILLIPLVAMQFTNQVNWNLSDFVIMGVLIFGTGLTYVLATRKVDNKSHKAAVGIVLLAVLLIVWVELAVGVFGTPIAGS